MQTYYTAEKVNNEIELCEVSDLECKRLIERELLKNRISYYIRWQKTSIFSHKKGLCVICVNDNIKDEAEQIVRSVCDESGFNVRFLLKKSTYTYF